MKLFLLLLSSLPVFAFAQSISGRVVDDKGAPLPSATVLLLKQKDSSLISSALTDTAGYFHFSSVKDGKYLVASSATGFGKKFVSAEIAGSDIQLGNTSLVRITGQLAEVTVTAVKPFLEQKPDKLVINIEGSATAAGSTGYPVV